MNLLKNEESQQYVQLCPSTPGLPDYLLEKKDDSVMVHRKLSKGETIWYNADQVKMYYKQLFIQNICTVRTFTEGVQYVSEIWNGGHEFKQIVDM